MGAVYPRAAQIRISRDAESAVSSLAAVHRNGSDGGTRTICRDPPNAAGDRARHPIARTLHCRRRRRAEHGARSAGSGRRDGLRPISPSFDFAREGAMLGAGLSQRQIENLDRWGYPYVFEDFRFHLTLTGPIDADRRGSVLALLQARFDAIDGGHSLPITRLS